MRFIALGFRRCIVPISGCLIQSKVPIGPRSRTPAARGAAVYARRVAGSRDGSPYRRTGRAERVAATEEIFTASSLVEAQLVLDLLLDAGVEARLMGAHLAGGFGELPHRDSLPKIWLTNASHRDDALEIIRQYQARQKTISDETLECPECGEENPGNFELCWSCRAEL